MTLSEFTAIVEAVPEAVVLLEGRRAIPDRDAAFATHTASMLVKQFPALRFRSGNATGSDQAFSEGIAQVAPWRLQIVAPYAGHRKSARYSQAVYDSPESLIQPSAWHADSLHSLPLLPSSRKNFSSPGS